MYRVSWSIMVLSCKMTSVTYQQYSAKGAKLDSSICPSEAQCEMRIGHYKYKYQKCENYSYQ